MAVIGAMYHEGAHKQTEQSAAWYGKYIAAAGDVWGINNPGIPLAIYGREVEVMNCEGLTDWRARLLGNHRGMYVPAICTITADMWADFKKPVLVPEGHRL